MNSFHRWRGRERGRENCQGRKRKTGVNGANSYGPHIKVGKDAEEESQPQKKLCEEKERRIDALCMITSFT